jgi:DNA recombination protein RmuC
MSETFFYLLLGFFVVIGVLQLLLLLRKNSFETPADLNARLALLEQNLQVLLQTSARHEGGNERLDQQLRLLTDTTGQQLELSRRTLDGQLDKTVEESRNGRLELIQSFQQFENRLEQRIIGQLNQAQVDATLMRKEITDALATFRAEITGTLAALSKETLQSRNTLAESATLFEQHIQERFEKLSLTSQGTFDSLKADMHNQLGAVSTAIKVQFVTLQDTVVQQLSTLAQGSGQNFEQFRADAALMRKETTDTLATFRSEMTGTLAALSKETLQSRNTLAESATLFEQHIQERFEKLSLTSQGTFDSLKADVNHQLGMVSAAMKDQFSTLQGAVVQQLSILAQGSAENSKALRDELNNRLGAIQADNSAKLEEMRRTVDEKLHATLEQRLGDSFKRVSDHLEQVHAGLGEMRTLAGSVGDLKRVMTNVRTRGTWGEVQLGAIIENLLTAEQYGQNVKTVPGSNELVEYAVRMPGKTEDDPVWLPIDSKYPVEVYQRLLDAHEAADKAGVDRAAAAFASAIEAEAKKIATKYLSPPQTTDFAILFLPTEGLFAEVARMSGMIELLQNKHRVMVAGPTTLAAMLNSLRLGFRTLVIEKRSSEVWKILGTVKTEFQKFGDAVDATKKSIDAAAKKFDEIGTRTRVMNRSLKDVEALPTPGEALLLDDNSAA